MSLRSGEAAQFEWLSQAELDQLRGIRLEVVGDEKLEALQQLGPRTCVSLRYPIGYHALDSVLKALAAAGSVSQGRTVASPAEPLEPLLEEPSPKYSLPKFSPSVTCLRVGSREDEPPESEFNPGLEFGVDLDLSGLLTLESLRFLELEPVGGGAKVDLQLIANAKNLKYLALRVRDLEHLERIARHTELRHLEVGWPNALESLSFLSSFHSLRELCLEQVETKEGSRWHEGEDFSKLRALDDLEALELTLPEVPRVRRLRVLHSSVPADELARVRKDNPDCRIVETRRELIRALLVGADGVRLFRRNGREGSSVTEYFALTSEQEVSRLVDALEIDEEHSKGRCACLSYDFIEFSRGGTLVARARLVGAKHMIWANQGLMETELTAKSAAAFADWLASHGVIAEVGRLRQSSEPESPAAK